MTTDLDLLKADPDLIDDLSPDVLPGILDRASQEHGRLAVLERRVHARLRRLQTAATAGDHLLGVDDAAGRLGVTRDWLRRRPTLPFVVKLSDGVVRYSARALDAFIVQHRAG